MMKLGKQINEGFRCPVCKMFGLEPRHIPITYMYVADQPGHNNQMVENFFRCRNCYAEFEALDGK